MDSIGFAEKTPFDQFGRNQYSSNHYIAPNGPRGPPGRRNVSGASAARSTRSGRSGRSQKRGSVPTNLTKQRLLFLGIPVALLIIAGIVIGVVVATRKHSPSGASANSSANTAADEARLFGVAGSGTNGSVIQAEDGTQFTYINWFGGAWAVDPQRPYSVSGRAQSWSPSLLDKWVWGQHIARGVNLGGWLVTEPFIVPGLYEQYQTTTPKAVDEYTLSQAMGTDLAAKMEEHYKTFITEADFAEIASAGLNWVRIPLGFWAIETLEDEPFLAKVSWTYFLKAIGWARKYGLRILLDFHALPGSQNGWNHSGKQGSINWMYGVMGIVNAQRHLEYIRSLVEFISQDGIKEVVPMISLVNEVMAETVGQQVMEAFYYQAYEMIRGITGYGAGSGPIIAIHEGFLGVAEWQDFLSGADRLALDQHPYLAFPKQQVVSTWDANAKTACGWGGGTNDSQTTFGLTIGGEWSLAINDCGKWLDGVDSVPAYTAQGLGSCTEFEEWFNWNDTFRAGVLDYATANMDALQNWFFWTWKIGNSTELQYPPSPFWHYRLGWQNGWIPTDPRVAGGYCGRAKGVGGNQFAGTFPASATGAVSNPTIAPDQVSSHSVWPPTSIGPSFTRAQIALMPTLTQTGSPIVLPTQAHPLNATVVGSGWANANDVGGSWVKVEGCPYPDGYDATAASLLPTATCGGNVKGATTGGPTAIR